MKPIFQGHLDKLVARLVSEKKIKGAVFHLSREDQSESLISASGNLGPHSLFYIASINKLILSALTLRCIRDGKLKFSDKLTEFIDSEVLKGLHFFKGKDYSKEISVGLLLSNTSGLPCYLIDKAPGKEKTMNLLKKGKDEPWPLDRVLNHVKTMKPSYLPGKKGKANYSNTNFRLLAFILEKLSGKPIFEILQETFEEMQMSQTFVIKEKDNPEFLPVFSNGKPVFLSQYWASSGMDIISNAEDLMKVLKKIFEGYFYPLEKLEELEKWNSIFFPFQYGIGIQKFYTPRIFSPFKPVPDLIGHCGSTGTAAFYVPEKKIYITGAINQTERPQLLFQTILKIIQKAG